MVTSLPTNASVVKGRTFSISFNYLAIPAPNFTWYINNNLHTEVEPTSESTDTHTMTFSNANKEGWYRCVVQNEHGMAEYTVFVDILSKHCKSKCNVSNVTFLSIQYRPRSLQLIIL